MATTSDKLCLAQRINRSKLIRAIQERRLISRSDLSELVGISPAQVTRLTRALIREKVIEEVNKSKGKDAGRKPVLLGLKKALSYVVGLDLGGSKTRLVVANMAGETIAKYSVPTPTQVGGDEIVDFLIEAVQQVTEDAQIHLGDLRGLSVAVGGSIAETPGREVSFSSIPAFKYFPLAGKLSERLGFDVQTISSGGAWILAECEYARRHNMDRDFLIVRCGYGISVAPLLAGKSHILRQEYTRAKHDFAHITHDPNGPECLCGSRGCIESYCGGWAIARLAEKNPSRILRNIAGGTKSHIEAKDVFDAANQGDQYSISILRFAGEILGKALAPFIQFYLPRQVIFSGQLVREDSIFFDGVCKAIRKSMPEKRFAKFQLVRTNLDEYQGAAAAASVMIREILHEPIEDLITFA